MEEVILAQTAQMLAFRQLWRWWKMWMSLAKRLFCNGNAGKNIHRYFGGKQAFKMWIGCNIIFARGYQR
jgi:hypothetical protein